MIQNLRPLMGVALVVMAASNLRAEPTAPSSSYAGQQHRAIKALSDSEVTELLRGDGAGFAKAAELNGYPGPVHVLEVAADLRLTPLQLASTRTLHNAHKREAARLGTELVEAERHLDDLFARRAATVVTVDQATAKVGHLRAQLRAEHLKTHLAQTALLSADQVKRYSTLRGYDEVSPRALSHDRGHSHHAR